MPLDNYWQPCQTPCASCPFRKDVDLMFWVREHYEMLLRSEGAIPGIVFGCHKYRERPPEEHVVCAGWLHDQRERGVPSIALRMALMMSDQAAAADEALATVEDGGFDLYTLVEACKVNIEAFEVCGDSPPLPLDLVERLRRFKERP